MITLPGTLTIFNFNNFISILSGRTKFMKNLAASDKNLDNEYNKEMQDLFRRLGMKNKVNMEKTTVPLLSCAEVKLNHVAIVTCMSTIYMYCRGT